MNSQDDFDLAIGRLDRVISVLVNFGKRYKGAKVSDSLTDQANKQTLKHHAEDMIAAANKILKDIGEVEGTSQPSPQPIPGPSPNQWGPNHQCVENMFGNCHICGRRMEGQ